MEKEQDGLYTPFDLATKLRVTNETLRRWETQGKIRSIKTQGGHRRYLYKQEIHTEQKQIIYARVSSRKQASDLERQVEFLKSRFPTYEVITDIGSRLNFKRKGLQTILELLFNRNISELVVAHKDRLCRFGFDLFEFMFKHHGSILTVLERERVHEPVKEFADDVLSIITVFTARYYGSRKYNVLQEDKNIPNSRASSTIQQVHRRKPILLQQSKRFYKRKVLASTINKT
jgi:predicted site-specific integrase-resolvase